MGTIGSTLGVWLCMLVVTLTLPLSALAQGTRFIGLLRDQNALIHFDSSDPTVILATVPITGVGTEIVRAIDVRPANGLLYAVTTSTADSAQVRLYTINQSTGAASAIGPAVTLTIAGSVWGMSFDPVADQLRLVNNARANARLHPDTGMLAGADTPLTSPNTPDIDAIAYDNQFPGASQSTLYAINRNLSGVPGLVRIGGPQGNPSASGGVPEPIGPIGFLVPGNTGIGLDAATDGTLFAVATPLASPATLYTINVATGLATSVGTIGNGSMSLDSLAVASSTLVISPGSGIFTRQQRFDMVLLLDAPGRALVGGSAVFDGVDVTGYVAQCVRVGHTAAGQLTLRCPSLGGPVFGAGTHTLTVTLALSGGDIAIARANWIVLPSTEP